MQNQCTDHMLKTNVQITSPRHLVTSAASGNQRCASTPMPLTSGDWSELQLLVATKWYLQARRGTTFL